MMKRTQLTRADVERSTMLDRAAAARREAARNQEAMNREGRTLREEIAAGNAWSGIADALTEQWPDKVASREDGWAVRFNGEIQSPRWAERGPAEAFLDALQNGKRQPEPEER